MAGARVVRRLGCAFVLAWIVAGGLSSGACAGSVTYGYDALGRLISVTGSNGVTTTYSYDAAGNRTQQAVSVTKPIAGVVNATVNGNSSNNSIPANISGATAIGVSISTGPAHGSASTSGLSLIYTPATGYVGQDTFQYTAANANGASDPATVFVTVNAAPPVVGAISQTVGLNSSGNIVTPNFTGGGTAASIAISSGPSHGSASVSGMQILYTPATGFTGTDTFQYTASNAAGSSTATVTITVSSSLAVWGSFNWGAAAW
jgi:YD repeat-containing protein